MIDRPESAGVFSLAVDRAIGDLDGAQAYTLRLSLFALAAARGSNAIRDPLLYGQGSALRRASFGITLGGPNQGLDSFRRQPNVTDHVTAELKLRIIGSRDRRDHWNQFRSAVDPSGASRPLHALVGSNEYLAATSRDPGDLGGYNGLLAALRNHPSLARAVLADLSPLTDAVRTFDDRIDRSFVLGLSLTADTYATGFGRDLYTTATLIGEVSRFLPLTVNVGFHAEEEVHEARNDELKLGAATSRRWLQSSNLLGPLDVTVGGSVLVRNHDRPDVWLGGIQFDSPLRSSLNAAVAVTFSNHPERAGEGVTRGSVSLSYVPFRSE